MKRTILSIGLSALATAAAAQSTVNISGVLKLDVAHRNGGTTPLDAGPATKGMSMNDLSSALIFSGREDLGGGLYAGFELASFLSLDTGASWDAPFWSRRSVIKFGGSFGEVYAGRSLTPSQLMLLLVDPWYWDGSAAQVGWGVQQANYTSTSFIRTNNTLGYVSPNMGGFTLSLAGAFGEKAKSPDIGGSLTYASGPLSLGFAFDRSKGFFDSDRYNRTVSLTGSYDFGVVKPMASFTSSRVDGASYRSFMVAATAPVGDSGLVKAQIGHLNDFDPGTASKQGLTRLGLGYQHNLSKRTNVFAQVARSKGETRSATNTMEFGIEHGF